MSAKRGRVTDAQRFVLAARQAGRCALCGFPLDARMHVDHIVPRKLGGKNRMSNYQLVCASCNLAKGAKAA